MFITDYDMKQYGLSMKVFPHINYRSSAEIAFAMGSTPSSHCRMWLSCGKLIASVSNNDNLISFDEIQVECNMRRIKADSTSPNGFKDVIDSSDSIFVEFCKVFNSILSELCESDSQFHRLRELYKLNGLAHWLATNKHLHITISDLENILISKKYPLNNYKAFAAGPVPASTPLHRRACADQVSVLIKQHSQQTVTSIPGGSSTSSRTITFTGGVDLSIN